MCILYWEEKVCGKGQARFGILAVQKIPRRSPFFQTCLLRERCNGGGKREPITHSLYCHMKIQSQSDDCSAVTWRYIVLPSGAVANFVFSVLQQERKNNSFQLSKGWNNACITILYTLHYFEWDLFLLIKLSYDQHSPNSEAGIQKSYQYDKLSKEWCSNKLILILILWFNLITALIKRKHIQLQQNKYSRHCSKVT